MKIWHRVSFGKLDSVDSILDGWGIKYKKTPGLHGYYIITFEIDETDPRWAEIAELVRQKNAPDFFNTKFTKEEILSAEWLRLIPIFEHGYPQPEDTWVTNPINYADHCPECGTFRQVSSFRLKTEPNLGKHDFMTLIWGSALFCIPKVLKELEAHHMQGYEVWRAIIHQTDLPSQKVSQLFIPTIAKPGLVRVDDLKREYCSTCHTLKYYPHMKGVMYLKREAVAPGVDFLLSYEWFGDGHVAYREILVSNRVARLILEKGWQGVALKVVELV
jgi:hypothetical protein